jgi:PEP-CTERM motif
VKHLIGCIFVFGITASVGFAAPSCSDPTTFCESGGGDAGQQLDTAGVTTGEGLLLNILGNLSDGTDGGDLYEIYISDPSEFSATTENTPSNNPDPNPALYLFDASGDAVYGIDDNSPTDTQATLQSGLSIGPQTAGIYYILIAPSGNMPERGDGNPLFDLVVGSDVAGNNGTLKHYSDGGCGADCEGKYDITLTGATFAVQTPEPQTLGLLGAGLLAVGLLRRKYRPGSV